MLECASCGKRSETNDKYSFAWIFCSKECQDEYIWQCKEWQSKHPIDDSTPKNGKIHISNDIRWDVWERDNFTCKKCGSRRNLTVDHIMPESKGGTLELTNLQTLCKKCNSSKGTK